MTRQFVPWLLGCLAVTGGVALAACPEACQDCSADPAFVQRDMRRPDLARMVRHASARKETVVETGTLLVVIHNDERPEDRTEATCCRRQAFCP